jgi:hypothetical protein
LQERNQDTFALKMATSVFAETWIT